MNRSFFTLVFVLVLMASDSALAHTGIGSVSGISAGFKHPISGIDHILAIIAVGILAAQLGGKFIWLVPAIFINMMVLSSLLSTGGVVEPFIELGIISSVVILGTTIAVGRQLSSLVVTGLAGGLAFFHGYAHGAEMPVDINSLEYGIGFIATTVLLCAIGAGIQKIGVKTTPLAIHTCGGAIAAVGIALFFITVV